MGKLILLRHGQSVWNKEGVFTGWVDVPLSEEGMVEARAAGQEIREMPIDVIFTSTLIRGIMTAMLAMCDHSSGKIPMIVHEEREGFEGWHACHNEILRKEMIPVMCAWELNERMYGKLQGMNKDQIRAQFGTEQVHLWRRSYDIAPPGGESLKMTKERTLPYFHEKILPYVHEGKNILVAAHGNSLRSIVMELNGLSEKQVLELEIPTGKPLFYHWDGTRLLST